LVIPITEGNEGHIFETQARKAKFFEICTFPKGQFRFKSPAAFKGDFNTLTIQEKLHFT